MRCYAQQMRCLTQQVPCLTQQERCLTQQVGCLTQQMLCLMSDTGVLLGTNTNYMTTPDSIIFRPLLTDVGDDRQTSAEFGKPWVVKFPIDN